MIRTTILWLAFWTSAGALAGAQSLEPAPEPSHVPAEADPLSVGMALEAPGSVDGRPLRVEGTVIRTARLRRSGENALSLLIRDAAGDTLSVAGMDPLPAVGARVAVSGTLRTTARGRLELVDGVEPLRLEVVWEPRREVGARAEDGHSVGGPFSGRAGTATLAAAGLLLLGVGATWLMRRRPRPGEADEIPLIVALDVPADREAEPAPAMSGASAMVTATEPLREDAPGFAAEAPPQPSRAAALAERVRTAAVHRSAPPAEGVAELAQVVRRHGAHGPPPPAGDEVLQLLPGRLEVIEGSAVGPEFRFFRLSSRELPEITFGRQRGPRHRHVELPAPTVSGLHACLRFRGQFWTIANLSATNPVVVNDETLGAPEKERTLRDGDRIRIGEYVFRFRGDRG